ncbi:MAG: hypothetical protein IT289_09310 [Oligoflexia bacterium]|nr:hypothetical protein [Oligoflexia bacterium]
MKFKTELRTVFGTRRVGISDLAYFSLLMILAIALFSACTPQQRKVDPSKPVVDLALNDQSLPASANNAEEARSASGSSSCDASWRAFLSTGFSFSPFVNVTVKAPELNPAFKDIESAGQFKSKRSKSYEGEALKEIIELEKIRSKTGELMIYIVHPKTFFQLYLRGLSKGNEAFGMPPMGLSSPIYSPEARDYLKLRGRSTRRDNLSTEIDVFRSYILEAVSQEAQVRERDIGWNDLMVKSPEATPVTTLVMMNYPGLNLEFNSAAQPSAQCLKELGFNKVRVMIDSWPQSEFSASDALKAAEWDNVTFGYSEVPAASGETNAHQLVCSGKVSFDKYKQSLIGSIAAWSPELTVSFSGVNKLPRTFGDLKSFCSQ